MYVRSDYRPKRGCICISQLVSQTAWQAGRPSCPLLPPETTPCTRSNVVVRGQETGRFEHGSAVLANRSLQMLFRSFCSLPERVIEILPDNSLPVTAKIRQEKRPSAKVKGSSFHERNQQTQSWCVVRAFRSMLRPASSHVLISINNTETRTYTYQTEIKHRENFENSSFRGVYSRKFQRTFPLQLMRWCIRLFLRVPSPADDGGGPRFAPVYSGARTRARSRRTRELRKGLSVIVHTVRRLRYSPIGLA